MKITYPECQIEISTDEFIDLMDYFEDREPKIECRHEFGPLNYKKPELYKPEISEEVKKEIEESLRKHLEESGPVFNPFSSTESDLQPAPNPYPNLTDQEAIIPRGTSFQDLIKQGLKEAEAQGKLPEVKIPTEEEPAPVEIPIERNPESTKKEAPTSDDSTKKKKASGKPKKVQVLFETGWKTFNSISQAAKAVDARLNHLSHALLNGKTCNGHQVRYYSEIDDIMAEINENNRRPYEPSKPVR